MPNMRSARAPFMTNCNIQMKIVAISFLPAKYLVTASHKELVSDRFPMHSCLRDLNISELHTALHGQLHLLIHLQIIYKYSDEQLKMELMV